jgi:anaerobic selenocysteine-containing dehydrogenase
MASGPGAKLIVLDPRMSNTAAHADAWLAPWPGSEAAILLAKLDILHDEIVARQEVAAAYDTALAPLGLRMGKEALNRIEFMPVEEGYAIEQHNSTKLMATEDAREATRAVVEKRQPVFRGR